MWCRCLLIQEYNNVANHPLTSFCVDVVSLPSDTGGVQRVANHPLTSFCVDVVSLPAAATPHPHKNNIPKSEAMRIQKNDSNLTYPNTSGLTIFGGRCPWK